MATRHVIARLSRRINALAAYAGRPVYVFGEDQSESRACSRGLSSEATAGSWPAAVSGLLERR
jgi:hypothetical protein